MERVPSLSVCFPVFNEEGNIERSVHEAAAAIAPLCERPEIVAVDDCSRDRTPRLLDRLRESYPFLKVVHLSHNTRFAGALARALKEASGELVFYTDADCPVDFGDLHDVLPLMHRVDVIAGYRVDRHEGLRRALYSSGYNLLIETMFGLRVRDVNFAFKLFRRAVIEAIEIRSRGSFIDAELLLEARRHGFTVRQVGVHYRPRVAGESTLADPGIARRCATEALRYRLGLAPWARNGAPDPR